jgi:hypothetical protein
MFIVGAMPDSLLMKKQKSYKFKEEERAKSPNRAKKSFWSKVTGGRMK